MALEGLPLDGDRDGGIGDWSGYRTVEGEANSESFEYRTEPLLVVFQLLEMDDGEIASPLKI
jgi:hypothetical protein